MNDLSVQADAAALHYGFTDEERAEWLRVQTAIASNPALRSKIVRRQRRFMRAQRMSPTIKTRSK